MPNINDQFISSNEKYSDDMNRLLELVITLIDQPQPPADTNYHGSHSCSSHKLGSA